MKWLIVALLFPILVTGAVLLVLWNNDVLDDFSFSVNVKGAEPEASAPTTDIPPPREPLVESSVRFWAQAKPIVERQIAEVGLPLTTIIIQNEKVNRELRGAPLSEWYEVLLGVAPKLTDSYEALSSLRAPPGRATRWHEAQIRTWGIRLDSIDVLSAN